VSNVSQNKRSLSYLAAVDSPPTRFALAALSVLVSGPSYSYQTWQTLQPTHRSFHDSSNLPVHATHTPFYASLFRDGGQRSLKSLPSSFLFTFVGALGAGAICGKIAELYRQTEGLTITELTTSGLTTVTVAGITHYLTHSSYNQPLIPTAESPSIQSSGKSYQSLDSLWALRMLVSFVGVTLGTSWARSK